ncbi:hypothetical protein LCGC14_1298790 [marine sediment metagenome]|uniref:Portal protein n=1 Tax=marine sediment metagenome TaxID=412755 RepID=A0A0F9LAV2_9ZZZZ
MAENKEETFIAMLTKKEEAGMKKTEEWVSLWQESLRYFFGDQLAHKKEHKEWDWIVINYIWPSAMQEIAKLSKNFSEIHALPWNDDDADSAEAWQNILQWQWEKGINRSGMRLEQIYAILCGKIFGYRVSKIFWDEKCTWDDKQKRWMGDVRHKLWHPAEFWASDNEKIEDGDCGTVRFVDLEWAQARWPQFKKKLELKASKYKDLVSGGDTTIRGQLASAGTFPAKGKGGIDKGLGANDQNRILDRILDSDRMTNTDIDEDKQFVKLSETYFKDYLETKQKIEEDIPPQELIESGEMFSQDGVFYDTRGKPVDMDNWPKRTTKEWTEPDYPTGRYVIHVDDLILNPDDQKYPYSRWPFVVIPHYLLPFMWQGINGVTLYKNVQDMINVTVSHLTNNMKMFGDPKIMVEKGAIDTPPGRHKEHFRIGKAAGSIIRLVKGGIKRVAVIPPVTPSAAALQLYGLFTQEFKNLIGLQDVAQGKAGKNLTATESSYLAISSHDRISLQNVFETEWVRKCCELIAGICQAKYEPERWVRIVGDDKAAGVMQITQEMNQVRFDVDIQPAPAIPMDAEKRLVKLNKAYELMGGPPNVMMPEMLKALEVPNWRKLLQEHSVWVEYMKFQQLYNAVAEGKIDPKEGVRILIAAISQKIGQQLDLNPRKTNEKGTEVKTEIKREKTTDSSPEGGTQTVEGFTQTTTGPQSGETDGNR